MNEPALVENRRRAMVLVDEITENIESIENKLSIVIQYQEKDDESTAEDCELNSALARVLLRLGQLRDNIVL